MTDAGQAILGAVIAEPADASRMALAWARAAAGLPPLPAAGGGSC